MQRMMKEQADEFYYVTVMNENYRQPNMPAGAEAGIIKGLYQIGARGTGAARARLVGAGTILNEIIAAADMLSEDFGIASDIFSATSFSELAR